VFAYVFASVEVLSRILCTNSVCGICIKPRQCFELGRADRPLIVTSNRCIPVKKYVGRKRNRVLCVWYNTVVFCRVLCGKSCASST